MPGFSRVNQAATYNNASANSIASTALALAGGNMNLVQVCASNAGAGVGVPTAVNDTAGNTYVKVLTSPNTPTNLIVTSWWLCLAAIANAANIATATFGGNTTWRGILVAQYVRPAGTILRSAHAGVTIQAGWNLGQTTQDDALIINGLTLDNAGWAWTPGSGWTTVAVDANGVQYMEERIVTANTTVNLDGSSTAAFQKDAGTLIFTPSSAGVAYSVIG